MRVYIRFHNGRFRVYRNDWQMSAHKTQTEATNHVRANGWTLAE